jgi:hypothetical protein
MEEAFCRLSVKKCKLIELALLFLIKTKIKKINEKKIIEYLKDKRSI